MSFDHPLVLWALPAVVVGVLLLERRLPAGAGRRLARAAARCAVLAAALLALAGPRGRGSVPRPRRLVLLRDAASRPGLEEGEALARLRDRVRDAAAAGGLAWQEVDFTTRAAAPGEDAPPASRGSSLAAGLAAAHLCFAPRESGGVYVLTDARGDLRGAAQAVASLRTDGLSVGGLAVPAHVPPAAPTARVLALDVPARVRGPFAVRARLALPPPGARRALLLVDGRQAQARDLPPSKEGASLRFDELDLEPGWHEVALELRAAAGSEGAGEAPRLVRRLVQVGAPPRVLRVRLPGSVSPWGGALRAQGLALEEVAPQELAARLGPGRALPDVVLADAAALAALSPEAAARLHGRVHDGLGLVLEAGGDAGAWAGLAEGPLADLLPLRPRPEPPPPPPAKPPAPQPPPADVDPPEKDEGPGLKAERRPEEALPITLLLVLDRSPSMDGAKLEMAKLGATLAARALSPWDRIGIITFADDVTVDVSPRSARAARSLPMWLTSVQAGGEGTNIVGALKKASEVLATETSPILHLVLLTDGRQYPSGPLFGPVVRPMGQRGVTITAVGIGRGARLDQLRDIVQWAARGRIESAATPRDIPRLLTRDTEAVAERRRGKAIDARLRDKRRHPEPRPPDRKAPTPPPRPAQPETHPAPDAGGPPASSALPLRQVRAHEALAGFAHGDWPSVGTPRRAQPVPGAAVLLERTDGAPVLAAGRAGLGRVLVWALPPRDPGALAWKGLGRLLAQTARSALPPEGALAWQPRARVRTTPDGARLEVLWPAGSEEGSVQARWVGPDGASRELGAFTPQDAPGGRPLPPAPAGSRCRIQLRRADGTLLPPVSYLQAAAPHPLARPGDSAALAEVLGAEPGPPEAFAEALPVRRRPVRPPRWAAFLWLAVVLLPLDVLLHRRSGRP
jgi:hypothetical protein